VGFLDRLDAWAEQESPPAELRRFVTSWIMTRLEDPYQGVRRASGFENLWFGPIPGSDRDGSGTIVTCSYWIDESTRTLRCDSFATLSLPI
jgi:hypothetical protein